MTIVRTTGRPKLPAPLMTTGIGSLPHTQLELAMQQALLVDIPYLPQLPMKDPAEFMIPQALEGLPGLEPDGEGNVTLRVAEWERGSRELDERLDRALEKGKTAEFEPGSDSCCAWKPFLWEIEDRKLSFAKAQSAGPVTGRLALKLDDGRPVTALPRLEQQVFRLVLARSLAMVRAIRERGATPLFFLDEPSLYLLDRRRNPGHALLFEELKILVLALQKEGALVGMHCCGNTEWGPVLGLNIDVLSSDTRLSLGAMLAAGEAFWKYIESGGQLALGIVPTNVAASYDLDGLLTAALALIKAHARDPAQARRVLEQSLLTPACGLALRTVPDSETAFEDLARAQAVLKAELGQRA